MYPKKYSYIGWISLVVFFLFPTFLFAATAEHSSFPLPLDSYKDEGLALLDILKHRIEVEPFNLVVSLIFLCAIIHAFTANKITKFSHLLVVRHQEKQKRLKQKETPSIAAEFTHFFGEVEAVFGIWLVVLLFFFLGFKGWHAFESYVNTVKYTEAVFVVVIMSIAASRPILLLASNNIKIIANLFGGSTAAYWFCILSFPPLIGSFITEPAAMTIAALLLAKQFYEKKPSPRFAYATIGLLFVNVSVGGTLTHFAAPPVLIVANAWDWGIVHMASNFGWKAALGILTANTVYFFIFRKSFKKMEPHKDSDIPERVPFVITAVHILFIVWTVLTGHYIALFVGGFLFFLAFAQATREFQSTINLKSPLLVGFFLAGLVTHGGLQAWWIAPVLSSLSELQLFWGATILTAFNDNAAITYLSSLVPTFSDSMKYAVVAGALTGGGLTVIANAPNPARKKPTRRGDFKLIVDWNSLVA